MIGSLIGLCMALMYAGAFPNVKRAHYKIFTFTHSLFWLYYLLLFAHGKEGYNSTMYRWFAIPGCLYILERIIRLFDDAKPATLLTITHMRPNTIVIEMSKHGLFPYQEGQGIFINCPRVSNHQWKLFTISSAPQDDTIIVRAEVTDINGWAANVREFLQTLGPPDSTSYALLHQGQDGSAKDGLTFGTDGSPLLLIDGPRGSPTQHLSKYDNVMMIATSMCFVFCILISFYFYLFCFNLFKNFKIMIDKKKQTQKVNILLLLFLVCKV